MEVYKLGILIVTVPTLLFCYKLVRNHIKFLESRIDYWHGLFKEGRDINNKIMAGYKKDTNNDKGKPQKEQG